MNLFSRELSMNAENAIIVGAIFGIAGAGVLVYGLYILWRYPPFSTIDPILNAVPSEHHLPSIRFAYSDIESSIVANSFIENDLFSFLGLNIYQINLFLIIYNLLFIIQILIVNNYDYFDKKYYWYLKKHKDLALSFRYLAMRSYVNIYLLNIFNK